jgi:hypothetical protein
VFEQDDLWGMNGLKARSNLLQLNERSLRLLFAIVNYFNVTQAETKSSVA